jgi:hypothetical protein
MKTLKQIMEDKDKTKFRVMTPNGTFYDFEILTMIKDWSINHS